jgi:hypothetical protein
MVEVDFTFAHFWNVPVGQGLGEPCRIPFPSSSSPSLRRHGQCQSPRPVGVAVELLAMSRQTELKQKAACGVWGGV